LDFLAVERYYVAIRDNYMSFCESFKTRVVKSLPQGLSFSLVDVSRPINIYLNMM